MSLERSSLDEVKTRAEPSKILRSQNSKRLSTFLTNNYIYIINLLLKYGLTVAVFC